MNYGLKTLGASPEPCLPDMSLASEVSSYYSDDNLLLDRAAVLASRALVGRSFLVYDPPFPIRLFVGGRAVERSSCGAEVPCSLVGRPCALRLVSRV